MQKQKITHILQSGQAVTANVLGRTQLCAKFITWARDKKGVDNDTALACFIANTPEKHLLYFESSREVETLANIGFAQIVGEIPDISEYPIKYDTYKV